MALNPHQVPLVKHVYQTNKALKSNTNRFSGLDAFCRKGMVDILISLSLSYQRHNNKPCTMHAPLNALLAENAIMALQHTRSM